MKIKEQYITAIPEFWLPYLINGDTDNISDSELQEIQNFENQEAIIDPCFKPDNYPYFGILRNVGHQLIDVQITIFKK